MDKNIKLFINKELGYEEKRNIAMEIVEVIQKNNLSLKQTNEIFELVKENLDEKPLWN